jgi:hypothetical protein
VRGRSGGRGRGNRNGGSGRGGGSRAPVLPAFPGNTDGMKGNIFQCHGESKSKQQLLKTVGVLEEHINKTFEYPQDVASICKKRETTEIRIPREIRQDEYHKSMTKKMKSYMMRLE